MTADQLERLRLMASGNDKWDLSENDCAAIGAACDRIDELYRQVRCTLIEKPESLLADCCRLAKCTHVVDDQRVDYIPPHDCVGQEPEDQLNDLIADRIIEVMNRMIESDPKATGAILCTRHNCNQRLVDDPTIQVAGGIVRRREPPTVGLLGILNGSAGVLPKTSDKPGYGRVTAVYNLLCPVHGEDLEANNGSKVGEACLIVDCVATLELGSLVRFERTEKQ